MRYRSQRQTDSSSAHDMVVEANKYPNATWSTVNAFLLAWFTASFAAAVTYLLSSMVSMGKLYGFYELAYGLAFEMVLAAIAIPVVAVPLTLLVVRLRPPTFVTALGFIVVGIAYGAFVFDYAAGGVLRDWLLGGSIPGVVSGLAFFAVLYRTKLRAVDGR